MDVISYHGGNCWQQRNCTLLCILTEFKFRKTDFNQGVRNGGWRVKLSAGDNTGERQKMGQEQKGADSREKRGVRDKSSSEAKMTVEGHNRRKMQVDLLQNWNKTREFWSLMLSAVPQKAVNSWTLPVHICSIPPSSGRCRQKIKNVSFPLCYFVSGVQIPSSTKNPALQWSL